MQNPMVSALIERKTLRKMKGRQIKAESLKNDVGIASKRMNPITLWEKTEDIGCITVTVIDGAL